MPTQKELEQSEDLRTLFQSREWKAFADMCEALKDKWSSNLVQFEQGFTIEQIAIERVKWVSMIHGVEVLFVEMNRILDELRTVEKERKESNANREKRRD